VLYSRVTGPESTSLDNFVALSILLDLQFNESREGVGEMIIVSILILAANCFFFG